MAYAGLVPDEISDHVPRGVALAWGIAEAPQRGPKREMSIERIVEAAVEIADAEGLTAVSMSSVAARLGFTTMSLYRYVTAKDDLLVLMNEEGVGLPPDHQVPGEDWSSGLRRWLDSLKRAYEDHPWLLDIALTGIPMTPNNLAWLDWGLRILRPTSLSPSEAVGTVLMLSGMARWEGMISRASSASEQRGEGVVLRELVTADRYPDLFAAAATGVFDPSDRFDPYAFSIARVLDGLTAYVQSRPATPPTPPEPIPPYARDAKIKEATQQRRDAESRLRDTRKREAELIQAAVAKAAREAARARDGMVN